MMKFDHAVSLGGSCKAAYEARACFDFGEAYPFDWWISRADQIARYLRAPNPDALYAPDNLRVMKTNRGGTQVGSVTHDFRFHHEFPRDWDVMGAPIAPHWESAATNAKARHIRLLDRLFGLNVPEKRILFIRTCEEEGDTEALPDLLDALTVRFARAQWRLLTVNSTAPVHDKRLLTANFPLAELAWSGRPTPAWRRAFSRLGLEVREGAKPFDPKVGAEHD